MKNLIRTCSTAMLVAAFGAPSAFAQERTGLDYQFKARTGYGLKAADNLTRRVIGFGLELGYNTSIGRFGAELGYQYKPGDRYLYDVVGKTPTVNGVVVIPGFISGTYQGTAIANGAVSGDFRTQRFDGALLRLSYERNINESMSLRAGVQLFGARFRQEVMGNAVYRDPENPDRVSDLSDPLWRVVTGGSYIIDAYGGNVSTSDIAPSPFVGLGFRVNSNVTVEANLVGLSYKVIDYVHVAGTGRVRGTAALDAVHNPGNNVSQDKTEEKSTMVPHIEFAIAFRF